MLSIKHRSTLKWRNIVEVGGLFAFLLGMYFVYAEIQQNGVIARAELAIYTNQRVYELQNRFLDPEFSAMYLKGLYSPAELDDYERFRLNAFYDSMRLIMGYEYRNYRLGLFENYEGVTRNLARRYLSHGYGQAWWRLKRSRMNPEIVRVVDLELLNSDGSDFWTEFDSQLVQQIEALQ